MLCVYLFSSVYYYDAFDKLVVSVESNGEISYILDYGNEGKVTLEVSDIGTTVIDGLDEYLENFTGVSE